MRKTAEGTPNTLGRRALLRAVGGTALLAAGSGLVPGFLRRALGPAGIARAAEPAPNLVYAGTDGWIALPGTPELPPFHPDPYAPAPFNTYIFGFRNITGLDAAQVAGQKMKAQAPAPIFWVSQYDGTNEFRLALTNLGLQMRPDLTDSHTLHWHGFRNVIPFFDGEPTGSISVPVGRLFTYVYRPRDPGTYMFHCHVEDVEHVHMGMTGLVFVRPIQDGRPFTHQGRTFTRFAYNDGDGSTGFDREFAMLLTEIWAEAHWDDAHIQLPDWSDYRADFALLNGRVHPDTLAPNGSVNPFAPVHDAGGDLVPTPGHEHLQYQPISSLVRCNAGDRVLLRFANLGFRQAVMTTPGLRLRVVGKDATPMRGRDGTDTSYGVETLSFGAGESIDAIFTAPAYRGPGPFDRYLLFNRALSRADGLAGGTSGQRTEIHVHPPGTLGPQQFPNDWA
jgi:FtsP/CotA-like multicopper oxidase with cupredoxin domain